jgi:hypothetical protein
VIKLSLLTAVQLQPLGAVTLTLSVPPLAGKFRLVGLIENAQPGALTVTVKVQGAILPTASVAVQVTVVVPTGKLEPDGGEHVTVTPGQLSLAVGAG